ncbi:hypothetical protein SLE2022_238830 [Rubroshorea leprosula]
MLATEVKKLEYNSTVELVFQRTNLLRGSNHPMHLHGFSFYVVGAVLGDFDNEIDPLKHNLVDPPLSNTIIVPVNGWLAIDSKLKILECGICIAISIDTCYGAWMQYSQLKMANLQMPEYHYHHLTCHRVISLSKLHPRSQILWVQIYVLYMWKKSRIAILASI